MHHIVPRHEGPEQVAIGYDVALSVSEVVQEKYLGENREPGCDYQVYCCPVETNLHITDSRS